MKFGPLCHITKGNFLSKNSTENVAWKIVPGLFLVLQNPL